MGSGGLKGQCSLIKMDLLLVFYNLRYFVAMLVLL